MAANQQEQTVDLYQAKTQVLNNGSQTETPALSQPLANQSEVTAPIPEVDCGCSEKSGQVSGQPIQTGAPSYVYAIGRIEPRFPSLSVEREFSQVRTVERRATAGKTDRETLYLVLA